MAVMETAAADAAADHSPAVDSEPVEVVMPKSKRSPSDFLKSVLGRPVRVKLNSGTEYRGVLACLDGYMNIAMEQTEEYVDGQLKAKYGDCFIRGNNGTFLHSFVYTSCARPYNDTHLLYGLLVLRSTYNHNHESNLIQPALTFIHFHFHLEFIQFAVLYISGPKKR
jgi:U6 snRNA-associated Sm-like protein LSm6